MSERCWILFFIFLVERAVGGSEGGGLRDLREFLDE